MREADLEAVLAIEGQAFRSPWRRHHFQHELHHNPHAFNGVVRLKRQLLGYACCWMLHEEMTLNNIAVASSSRGRGLGRFMLERFFEEARVRGCLRVILDVRHSNTAARRLYEEMGFGEIGRRTNYYEVEGEDAVVMSLELAGYNGSPQGHEGPPSNKG